MILNQNYKKKDVTGSDQNSQIRPDSDLNQTWPKRLLYSFFLASTARIPGSVGSKQNIKLCYLFNTSPRRTRTERNVQKHSRKRERESHIERERETEIDGERGGERKRQIGE